MRIAPPFFQNRPPTFRNSAPPAEDGMEAPRSSLPFSAQMLDESADAARSRPPVRKVTLSFTISGDSVSARGFLVMAATFRVPTSRGRGMLERRANAHRASP